MIRLYVETTFPLEIAFGQDSAESCDHLLQRAEAKELELVIPAFSLIEGFGKFGRQALDREEIIAAAQKQINSMRRTKEYPALKAEGVNLRNAFETKNEVEKKTLDTVVARLVAVAQVVPLTQEIIVRSREYAKTYALKAADAAVLASVVSHLEQGASAHRMFVTTNPIDFGKPDLEEMLNKLDCELCLNFDRARHLLKDVRP